MDGYGFFSSRHGVIRGSAKATMGCGQRATVLDPRRLLDTVRWLQADTALPSPLRPVGLTVCYCETAEEYEAVIELQPDKTTPLALFQLAHVDDPKAGRGMH